MKNSKILSGLMGVCVGDALGFPVQFAPRQARVHAPVTGTISHPIWKWPAGFWSDDSSLTFCLAEALCDGFDLEAIANNFVCWRYDGYWTPLGQAFDVGGTTNKAMSRCGEFRRRYRYNRCDNWWAGGYLLRFR